MNIVEFMQEIKTRFELALEKKTGWGKEEVKKLYADISIEVLSEFLDSH
jgi:hypothetical protein